MTEVYYPDVRSPTFIFCSLSSSIRKRKKSKPSETTPFTRSSLASRFIDFSADQHGQIGRLEDHENLRDRSKRNSVLIDVKFETKNQDLNLYVYYDPSLGNSGMGDTREIDRAGPMTAEGRFDGFSDLPNVLRRWLFRAHCHEQTNGFFGVSDGLERIETETAKFKPLRRAPKTAMSFSSPRIE